MCIPTRTRLTYNNDKPWFTAKLRQLCQAKDNAYRKGDKVLYKQAKYTLETEIRVAKRNYSGKLRNKLSSSDLLQCGKVWKTLRITRQHPPALWRINTWQTILMSFTVGLKKTPHTCPEHLSTQPLTPPATPLSPTPATGNRWRWHAPGLQREQKEESTRTRQCFTSLP